MQRPGLIVVSVLLVAGLVLSGVAGMAVAQEAPTASGNVTDTATPVDQHDDPQNVSEQGDVARLSDWLGGHLSERLEEDMVQLSQGQYNRTEGQIDDEFESRLSQFVDVAGETNAEGDDRAAQQMNEVAEDQRELSEATQAYRETLEAYRAARERGNETEARRLARKLERLAEEIHDNGGAVRDGYQSLENETGRNMTAGTEAVTDIESNVSATQAEIRESTFVETAISVTTNRTVVAFDRPATFEGRLVTENGSAVANRSITIRTGDRNVTTKTDTEGRFSLVYRPVTIAVGDVSLSVTYRPHPESVYLGSNETVPLTIESVKPTVSLSDTPPEVAFGEPVAIGGTATVDERPVPGAPMALQIGGRVLDRSRAGSSGTVSLAPALPAAIQSGDRTLRLVAGQGDAAISPANTSDSVRIVNTATNLSIATETTNSTLLIRGRLTTADGAAVPGQRVRLVVGSTSETVTTNSTGAYAASLDGDRLGDAGNQLAVSATFDGSATNLESANASTTAVVPAAGEGSADTQGDSLFGLDGSWVVIGGTLVALVLLVGGIFVYLRWDRPTEDESVGGPSEGVLETTGPASEAEHWLDAARDALHQGDEPATISRSYAASYAQVQAHLTESEDRTPRELLAAAEGRVDAAVLDALARVTNAYEDMAFADSGARGASEVLENAHLVVEHPHSPGSMADD